MSDVLRRPHLRGHFCQVPNNVIRIPTRNATELWAKTLLMYRLSLPEVVDDFTALATEQLEIPRASYYRAMVLLAEWGFVERTKVRVGQWDYTWTTEVRWGTDGRPYSYHTDNCAVIPQITGSYPTDNCAVIPQITVAAPLTTPIARTLEHQELSGWVGEGFYPQDAPSEPVDERPAGCDPRWDAAVLAYEVHYLAAVANVPASKASGRLTADDRRRLERLLASGVPVDDLCATVSGMVLEFDQGNRWRADTPEGGFWHPLVFRRRNRVKYAEMWRRQSAVEGQSSSEAQLRSRFGRLGKWR